MIYLYRIYQWCIVAPIMLVYSIITALITMLGCLFNQEYWGYFPAKWWARVWCWLHLVRIRVVGRELIDHETSYVFVANHQGAYDIFSIYGYLGHNFKWMMRKGITNIPIIGTACPWYPSPSTAATRSCHAAPSTRRPAPLSSPSMRPSSTPVATISPR